MFILICVTPATHAQSQWQGTSPIYYDGGNVGIGSSNAWTKLHVWGPVTNSDTGIVRIDAPGSNATLKIGLDTDYAWIQSHGSRPLYINNSGNNTIINGLEGKLGIGTITPQAKVHVHNESYLGPSNGNNKLLLSVSGNVANHFANNLWLLRDSDSPAGQNQWWNARLHDGISIDYTFVTPGQDTKTWWERDPMENIQSWGHGNQTHMTLKNGALGLGTTDPDALLTVNGNVKCEEVSVEIIPDTPPDYVFEKDYNLLPLSELEAYISQNKHLPEVPSAKEMEANGLNLKETNLLLLKKVEELTLHLIEQDKKIEALQKNRKNPRKKN